MAPMAESTRKGRLDGLVAIVTGAGSSGPGVGNGKATSILFAREGAKVTLVDRKREAAEETAAMIAAEGGETLVVEGDVSKEADCKRIVEETVARFGRLDILDNNVGIDRGFVSVVDVTEKDWDDTMTVNVKSMMWMSKFAIPAMIASGDGGSIINISSLSALRPRGLTPYSTSKGAVIALTQAMAMDHAKDGVRVNCIAPGPVFTPMASGPGGMSEERRALRASTAPLGTEGTAWDIAWGAVYLASPESRWVTGIVLPIDGGLTSTAPAR
jgi:NAD(P)-dependent dehydrogenase (short-subunit alcohol dehydrogenase family)